MGSNLPPCEQSRQNVFGLLALIRRHVVARRRRQSRTLLVSRC
jgi:hypothetical protein